MLRPPDSTAELTVRISDDRPPRLPSLTMSDKIGHVVVNDDFETAAMAEPDFSEPIVTRGISDPTDLGSIGRSISQFCKLWDDEQFSVCFRSLDALLDRNPPEPVFKFTHLLLKRFATVDAVSHVHFDPSGQELRTASAFSKLFDVVVRAEDLDEWDLAVDGVDVLSGHEDVGPRRATDTQIAELFDDG